MTTITDYAKALLAGGLPSVLDYGNTAPGSAQGDTRPERVAPVGTAVDRGVTNEQTPFILTPVGIGVSLGGVFVIGLIVYFASRAR